MQEIDVSVVIPLYNEKENLIPLFEKLKSVINQINKKFEIIFVDDGSTDGSFEILKEIKSKEKELVKVVKLSRNFGQTSALQAGIDIAKGEIIITMDADLQNDPEDIPRLLNEIEKGADVVSGWRYKRKDPFWLKIASKIANKIIASLTGVNLHDFGCTLKAYKAKYLKRMKLYGELHRFLPALLAWQGCKITEIKVKHNKRLHGKSKYGVSKIFRVIPDIIIAKFYHSGFKTPIQQIGFIGILSFLIALISGILTIWMKLKRGIDMTGNPLLYLTILAIICGFLLIILAIIGEMICYTAYLQEKFPIYVTEEIL